MHIGDLEDTVQLHEITVTRVFTSRIHPSTRGLGPEWEGWRGLAFSGGRECQG